MRSIGFLLAFAARLYVCLVFFTHYLQGIESLNSKLQSPNLNAQLVNMNPEALNLEPLTLGKWSAKSSLRTCKAACAFILVISDCREVLLAIHQNLGGYPCTMSFFLQTLNQTLKPLGLGFQAWGIGFRWQGR